MRHTAIGYPVKGFFQDTLFLIYNKLGSFTAGDRAQAISDRIKQLGKEYCFKPDSLKLSPSETTMDLVFGEEIILNIAERDALWEDTTKEELARKYKGIIDSSVLKYKTATSFSTLAKEIGLALLVLVIIITLINYIIKLFRYTAKKIQAEEDKLIKGIKIKITLCLMQGGRYKHSLLQI